MTTPLDIQGLVSRNSSYATSHQALPLLSEIPSSPDSPSVTTVVVSCADPRICPEQFLNVSPGEIFVFRTFGGRVNKSVVQDILTLDTFGGPSQLQNIMIIHHTDCGAVHFSSQGVKDKISKRCPEFESTIAEWDVGTYDGKTAAETVVIDVQSIKNNKIMSDIIRANTTGFVFDIKTGLLNRVTD